MPVQSNALDRLGLGAEPDATDTLRLLDVTEALSLFITAAYLDTPLSAQNVVTFDNLTGTLCRELDIVEAVRTLMLAPDDKAQRTLSLSLWHSLRAATVFNSARRLNTHRSHRHPGHVEIRAMRPSGGSLIISLPLDKVIGSCFNPDSATHARHTVLKPTGPVRPNFRTV